MRVTEEDRSLPTVNLTCREDCERTLCKRERVIKLGVTFIKVRLIFLCRVSDRLRLSRVIVLTSVTIYQVGSEEVNHNNNNANKS